VPRFALAYNLDRYPAQRTAIWADVRLDNREELLAALGVPENGPAAGDADLILAAYRRWGDDCASHLLGDFAFALWDHQRGRLYCARDHAGIRQLSYYSDAGVFACASAPEQLLGYPQVPAEPDKATLANFLLDRFPDPDATLYQGIRRLPAAHFLVVTNRGVRLQRYWDPANLANSRPRTDEDIIDGFREVFGAAVQSRLAGSGDVAATLSGGLDSSAIVCVAHQLAPDALSRAYSLVFDDLPCDERRYIDDVVRATGIGVVSCLADRGAGAQPFQACASNQYPGVPCDATFSMNFDLLERARQQGTRVLLWGVGGDELLGSGDAYLSDFIRQGRFRSAGQAVSDRVRHSGISDLRRSGAACIRPLVPRRLRSGMRGLVRRRLPRWIREDFLRDAGALEPQSEPPWRFGCEAQERIYRGLTTGRTAGYSLPASDAMAAAFDMEFRHPFFDRRLIEYVLGLPPARAEFFAGKLLLREALRGTLPESIRTRLDKTGFDPLVDRGLHLESGTISSLICGSELTRMGAIDGKALEDVFEVHSRQAGQCSLRAANSRNGIASFLRAEVWLRAFRQQQRNQNAKHRNQTAGCGEQEVLLGSAPGLLR
jgi:asparagine synthase (glutamine-hydrolysing)